MTYDKESQTEKEDFLFLNVEDEFESPGGQNQGARNNPTTPGGKPKPTAALSALKNFTMSLGNSHSQSPGGNRKDFFPGSSKHAPRKALSQEEYNKIVSEKKFGDFLRLKATFMERALEQTDNAVDIIKDYTSKIKMVNKTSKTFNVLSSYEEDSLRGRPITSLQWSPLIPELFLSSYGAKVAVPSAKSYGSNTSANSAAGLTEFRDSRN